MKKSLLLAAFAASLLVPTLTSSALGQGVAVIDLNYIFKNHARFKASTEEMRASAQEADKDIKARRETITALNKRLRTLKPDRPDYRQLEQEIATQSADLNASFTLRKKDFERREARIYYTVYQEVIKEVEYYSRSRGISIVLRFNGEPINEHDPDNIVKHLNQQVVHVDSRYDITKQILDVLNKRRGPVTPTAAGRSPQGVPTRNR